jgi:hypothetical protein
MILNVDESFQDNDCFTLNSNAIVCHFKSKLSPASRALLREKVCSAKPL